MTTTHSTERRPYRQTYKTGRCWGCDRQRPLIAHGACNYCNRILHMEVGPCRVCSRVLRLPTRGLCVRCARELPAGLDGEDRRPRREYTAEELAAAKAREADFVNAVRPAVLRAANRSFRRWNFADRQDGLAEAVGLAWVAWVRLLADGHDPLRQVGLLAKRSVQAVRAWRRVTGCASGTDVLSRRVSWYGKAKVVRDLKSGSWDRLRDEDESLKLAAWLATLPEADRELAAFLATGGTVEEAMAHFNIRRRDVEDLGLRVFELASRP